MFIPILQLDNISLGVGEVLKSQQPNSRHVPHRKLTDGGAAMVEDYLSRTWNIIHCKGNMRESRRIRFNRRVLRHGSILKKFEGWPVISVSRKKEVYPKDVRVAEPCSFVEPLTGQITLRRNGQAAEHFLIETRQPLPVFCDQVRMRIFRCHPDILLQRLRCPQGL